MLTSDAYTGALNERFSEGKERNELRQYMSRKAAFTNYFSVKCFGREFNSWLM